PPPYRAAGIWQFIPQTARKYNLVVNESLDERLNPEKETDAAMRYYRDLMGLFQDWRLALRAYGEGESRVQQLIDQYNTRDPWELEKLDSKYGYLSGAMAMIIILKNPSLLD
ncbi:MAG: transglycosylase SLT domain-containing protein, partial [Bdellovibrionota bacterium]